MRSTIHRPLQWAGADPRRLASSAVRWPHLRQTPTWSRKNGGIYTTRALSEEYGFNDVDGTLPDYAVLDAAIEQAKKTFLAPMVDAGRFRERRLEAGFEGGDAVMRIGDVATPKAAG